MFLWKEGMFWGGGVSIYTKPFSRALNKFRNEALDVYT